MAPASGLPWPRTYAQIVRAAMESGGKELDMKRKAKPTKAPANLLGQMERLMGGVAEGRQSNNAREAQELVYDSWEAATAEDACKLLAQALELDSFNLDAWLGVLEFADYPAAEQVELLRHLVAMGEHNLREEFKEFKGHFWGVLETRPYMRARANLALLLIKLGRYEEAIAEHEGMLKLNPNDNQGIRYGLMACYLAVDRLDGARRLFRKYKERKYAAVWAWAYVLERFLSGATEEAAKALPEACKQNPHALDYFLGRKQLPRTMPDAYAMQSPEEAMIAWEILQPAWDRHPAAQQWLQAACRTAAKVSAIH